jgi:hypothetical protein
MAIISSEFGIWRMPVKARFSLIRDPVSDDEDAGCCQQGIGIVG